MSKLPLTLFARPAVLAVSLFVVAFGLRAFYQLTAIDELPLRADAAQYFRIAWNLTNHGVFSSAEPAEQAPEPDSYRGPLYPVLIAGLMTATGVSDTSPPSFRLLMFLHALAGGLAAALVFLLGRSWLPCLAALAAGVLTATWPLLITLSGHAITETLFCTLLVVAVTVHAAWSSKPESTLRLAATAAAWSLCILLNPIALPLPVLIGALSHPDRLPRYALMVLLALAPHAAWSVRSSDVSDASPLTSTHRLLENVLIGMEPDFNDYYQRHDEPQGHAARQRVAEATQAYVQGRASPTELVLARLASAPLELARHFIVKPFDFWRWDVQQGHGGPFVFRMLSTPFDTAAPYRALAWATRGLNPVLLGLAILPFAALCLSPRWRQWAWRTRTPLLVLGMIAYATAVHTLLTPDARYAAPFRPLQFLAAAWGACILVTVVRRRLPASPPDAPAAVAAEDGDR